MTELNTLYILYAITYGNLLASGLLVLIALSQIKTIRELKKGLVKKQSDLEKTFLIYNEVTKLYDANATIYKEEIKRLERKIRFLEKGIGIKRENPLPKQ